MYNYENVPRKTCGCDYMIGCICDYDERTEEEKLMDSFINFLDDWIYKKGNTKDIYENNIAEYIEMWLTVNWTLTGFLPTEEHFEHGNIVLIERYK